MAGAPSDELGDGSGGALHVQEDQAELGVGRGQQGEHCQLAGGREDTWYATNIEIVDYMADAARLQYTAAGDKVCNPNAQSIWVEVDGRHYEIPAGKTVALV